MNERTATVPRIVCGRFHLGRRLGQGTTGVVFCGRDRETGGEVAVKLFAVDESAAGPDAESAVARRLALVHPNVATCIAAGIESEYAFFVTDLGTDERGQPLTLRRYLTFQPGQRLGGEQTIDLGCQILSGLAELHANGLVHRNLKPENIILRVEADGALRAQLVDYALPLAAGDPAAAADHDRMLVEAVQSGEALATVVASVAHFSPEQRRGRPVGAASDIYAVGVLLHEMVSGRPELGSVLPSEINSDFPPEFDDVVARAVAREPDERWPTCGDMLASLEQIREDERREPGGVLAVLSQPLPSTAGDELASQAERPSLLPVATPVSVPAPSAPPSLRVAAAVAPPLGEESTPTAPATTEEFSLASAASLPAEEGVSAPVASPPAEENAGAREPGPEADDVPRRQRQGLVAALAVVLVVLVLGGAGGYWIWQERNRKERAAQTPAADVPEVEVHEESAPQAAEPGPASTPVVAPPSADTAVAAFEPEPEPAPAPIAAVAAAPAPVAPAPAQARDPRARVQAAPRLGLPRDPARLVALLSNDNASVREQAAAALLRLGPAAVLAASPSLRSPNEATARLALDLLAEYRKRIPQAADLLADTTQRSPFPDMRIRALRLLADVAPERACRAAMARLGDSDKDMHQAVLDVLRAHGGFVAGDLVRMAVTAKGDEKDQATGALLAIGEPAAEVVASCLARTDGEKHCQALLTLLAMMEKWPARAQTAVAKLAVESKSDRVQEQAAALFKRTGERGLRVMIEEGMGATTSRERDRAAALIARMGDEAVPALVRTYRDASSIRQRRAVRDALMQMGSPGVRGLLELLQTARKQRLQNELLQAFVDMGEDAVPELMRALRGAQWRREAIYAMSHMGRIVRTPLSELLDEPEPERPSRRNKVKRAEYEDLMEIRRSARSILDRID